MKNNADFLKGVYEKAEILSKKKEQEKYKYNKYLNYSSIAALFIIIPIMLFQSHINKNNNEPSPMDLPRTMAYGNIDYSFSNAEYILKGSIISKIDDDSQVELRFLVDKNLSGDVVENEVTILGSKEILNFLSDYRNLVVFLYKQDNNFYLINDSEGILIEHLPNTYVDIFGNEYSLEEIINEIDRSR
ncbi:hypothetical protein [Tissierella sp. Yu-01]|uniref:hypothetical protein n=1 Tax=Tissierella sp. Yu-01 TaxID=3035694 RepID=UPI00240DE92C|nr:hypothetical protein [Tissierella sp. Yu-01]WFA07777.1 hypothetical protein P3962_08525 [Tissierella sp. Yu-01]